MPIIVQCPTCERKLRVPDQLLGKKVKCPGCAGIFTAGDKAAPSTQPSSPAKTEGSDKAAPKVEMDPNLQLELDEPAPRPSSKGKKSEEIAETPSRSGRARDEEEPDDDKISCPHCGERIRASSIRCKYCGEEIGDEEEDEEDDRPSRRGKKKKKKKRRRSEYGDLEPHRGGMVLGLGLTSLLLFLGDSCICCCAIVPIVISGVGVGLGIPAWVMGQRDLAKMRDGRMDDSGRGSTQAGWICGMIGTILHGLSLVGSIIYLILFLLSQGLSAAMTPSGGGFGGGGNPPGRFSSDAPVLKLRDYLPSRQLAAPAAGK
jgi:hypothetical protein